MKYSRFIFSTLVLVFGFSLVLFSALKLSSGVVAVDTKGISPVVGQETSNSEGLNLPAMSADRQAGGESTEEIEVVDVEKKGKMDYYLPYPGILPDHPFYWFKMLRDRARLWLIRDVEARFERLLLYADKRVGAARTLIEGGQVELGVATATKAEKYLEQAVDQFEKVKKAGKAYPEKVEHLEKAIAKHEEVLREVKEEVPDQAKSALDQAIEKAVILQEKTRERFK